MDNITHSLIGGAAAEIALERLPEERRRQLRWTFWAVSVLANNAPDIDFLIPWILGQGRIDYLLHHRGHTHTWLLAVPLGLLCWFLVSLWMRAARHSRGEKKLLLILAAAGGILHVFADSWNIYGVHPMWPLHGRWYFGDAVFIVEPLLWLLLAPALAFTVEGRARWLLLGPQALLLVLAWAAPLLTLPLRILLSMGVMASPLWALVRSRVRAAAVGALLLVGVFHGLSFGVRRSFVTASGSAAEWKEIALTPFPSHPLCWNVFGVRIVNGEYRAAIGTYWLLSAEACPSLQQVRPTAMILAPDDLKNRGNLLWHGEFRAPLEEIRSLVRENCTAAAVMRFYRIPVWTSSGSTVVLGDLRFDREKDLGFSEIVVRRDDTSCPKGVPPWVEPSQGWLGSATETRGSERAKPR